MRYFGDYELLEEIGRGGMGVVYRAQQVSLNRLVAVKMLLHGDFAGEELVNRFHAEAEAVASLQHPNIVAIHEVGVHEGLRYFSMDYVEGQSLAALAGQKPLPPERAARYVRQMAQAIHYAHQRGILHRDLKPSNVVIDQLDQPRITDFGLAKRFVVPPSGGSPDEGRAKAGTSNELTLSGQVLGAPSFMPPEQAAGKRGEVGVPSDVYGLGATLYTLLTGRPPFLADSLPETLREVQTREPTPPRQLIPGVPRDLETICLKCLRKNPRDRYESAAALAEDLRRCQAGEPILAQPLSRAKRVRYWARRQPATLTWAVALALVLLLGGVGLLRHRLDLWQLQNAKELLYIWVGTDIYLTDRRATNWRKLPVQGSDVDVSPGGRRLCYLRRDRTNDWLLTSDLDGTAEKRLATTQSHGVWADDETIIYHAEDLRNVWSINIKTGQKRKLFNWSAVTPDGFAGHLALSPDRTRVLANPQNGAWSPSMDLFICDLHGQNVLTVWEDPGKDIEDNHALWLPGDRFVWCRYAKPGPDLREMAIVTCRLGETKYRALTDWEGLKWPLAASPDGSQVVFLKEIPPRGGGVEIWIMNTDGTEARQFTGKPFSLPREGDVGVRWFGRSLAGR
ncbi:MAG: serine/threonine-protein kinase [Verrucomicrobiota bacterium]